MIDKLTVTVPFTGDELYETIKLYDILRDMDFELSETQMKCLKNYKTQKLTEDFSNDKFRSRCKGCNGANPNGRKQAYADGCVGILPIQYPDMTIRDFFTMASQELEEQEEDF